MGSRLKLLVCLVALIFALLINGRAHAGTLTTLGSRVPWGVEGTYVVGGSNSSGAFLLNDVTNVFSSIPNADVARGISGNLVGGGFLGSSPAVNHGYVYNLATKAVTQLDDPFAGTVGFVNGARQGTTIDDIDGNTAVGYYVDSVGKQHGFLYNISTQQYTTLDYPGATKTALTGVSGNYIVGSGTAGFNAYNFLYNLSTSSFTLLPIAPSGIDGNNIIGGAGGSPALYNLATDVLTSNPIPASAFPSNVTLEHYGLNGVSGNTLVGEYQYFDGRNNVNAGFVYRIPEPATNLLALLATIALSLITRRARNRASPSAA